MRNCTWTWKWKWVAWRCLHQGICDRRTICVASRWRVSVMLSNSELHVLLFMARAGVLCWSTDRCWLTQLTAADAADDAAASANDDDDDDDDDNDDDDLRWAACRREETWKHWGGLGVTLQVPTARWEMTQPGHTTRSSSVLPRPSNWRTTRRKIWESFFIAQHGRSPRAVTYIPQLHCCYQFQLQLDYLRLTLLLVVKSSVCFLMESTSSSIAHRTLHCVRIK